MRSIRGDQASMSPRYWKTAKQVAYYFENLDNEQRDYDDDGWYKVRFSPLTTYADNDIPYLDRLARVWK